MAENWMTDLLANLQGGGAPAAFGPAASPFPDVPQTPTPEQEAAAAAAAREAAGQTMMRANQRRINPFGVPDMNSAGIQLAMDQAPAGTGVPGPAGMAPPAQGASAPFGIPPSVQLAAQLAAPPQTPPEPPGGPLPPGAVPLPRPRPADAPEIGPTDLSAQSRPSAAPMGVPAAPPVVAQTPASAGTIGPMRKISDLLMGVGGALSGDGGAATRGILKQRDDL